MTAANDQNGEAPSAPVHVTLLELSTVEATLDSNAANNSPEDRLVAYLDRRVLARALERLVVAQHWREDERAGVRSPPGSA